MNNAPLSRKGDIVVQQISEELLVYDLKANKAFCLNESSTLVWQLCDGTHSVSQIAERLSQTFNRPVSEELIWFAINQFINDRLLENGDELGNRFAGLSRRNVIRNVGFASAIVLPAISSLVAPEAMTAQSGPSACFDLLTSCSANGECCSGFCILPGGVGQTPTCCFGPFNTTRPGNDFESNITCPAGPPCSPSACVPSARGFCCSGDAVATSCAPVGDGTMQRCECLCA